MSLGGHCLKRKRLLEAILFFSSVFVFLMRLNSESLGFNWNHWMRFFLLEMHCQPFLLVLLGFTIFFAFGLYKEPFSFGAQTKTTKTPRKLPGLRPNSVISWVPSAPRHIDASDIAGCCMGKTDAWQRATAWG